MKAPRHMSLQNIEKTVFNDETTIREIQGQVEQLSVDIKKATTAETRAIHYCRRGALLRRVCSHINVIHVLVHLLSVAGEIL